MRFTLCWSVILCAGGALVAASPSPYPLPLGGGEGRVRGSAPVKSGKGWAYQAPVRPSVPRVQNAAWVRNPIDAFIAARHEAKGLRPASEANRTALIRRVTFDLTGLPPTPAAVEAFVNDPAPDAYEKVVDRLLASPRHGERWALYWLDLVRFAESDGFRADEPRPHAWRYRDYVIQAFNSDKPFDRFLSEQLAGDELYPGDAAALVATAFLRHFPDEFNARNLDQRRQEILNDITDTTAQVFLGLTYGCARCHDHKYDPIPQKDYYRLQAFFAAFSPRDDMVLGGRQELAQYEARLRTWEEKTSDLRQRMAELEAPYREKLSARDKSKFARELQDAYDTPPEKRTPYQQQIAELVAKQVQVNRDLMAKAMKPEVRKEWQKLDSGLAEFASLKPPPLSRTIGLTDIGPVAPPTHLLKRGNWRHKGEEVKPGFLSIIDSRTPTLPEPAPDAPTTGRRSVLAKWLTRPDHPLTARVLVNRLWQVHFGRGIVATPSDFGEQGDPPTHPELLDWLAREFVERGWSLKSMHRLMVTSATYRQAARLRNADFGLRNEDPSANPQSAIRNPQLVDPDNKLLWRMNRKRLEGEALRDAMLATADLLNIRMGGPSVFPELPAEMGTPRGRWPVSADPAERNRRSVYVFAKRNLRYPLFGAFDAPDGNEPCARRHVSTNAPQALMLLNGKLTQDVARALAARVLSETRGESASVVDRAYRLTLGRGPDARERTLSADFLDRQEALLRERLARREPVALPASAPPGTEPARGAAVVDLCHVLLNLNEFAYVD
ncbi:MAG: DUF1553 domain-containing protein [Gemmataceae bacterium]|nr:DUF1553 domain-containing protein [Gemmataceae bacterium]